jgi:uncharacterized protein (TIGR03435 family)
MTPKTSFFPSAWITAFGLITIGVLNAPIGRAQESHSSDAFVASVKPNKSGDQGAGFDYSSATGFSASNVTLEVLIEEAYGIQQFQISDGPGWIRSERFDIQAKANSSTDSDSQPARGAGGLDKARRRQMIQTLLASRFALKVHPETKEEPVYSLVVFKSSPKLQDVTASVNKSSSTQPALSGRKAPGIRVGMGHMFGHAVSLKSFADVLSRILGRAVVDETGLTGLYDFTLDWRPDQFQFPTISQLDQPAGAQPSFSDEPSVFVALQEQAGLKLQARRGLVQMLVIDSAERPSAN